MKAERPSAPLQDAPSRLSRQSIGEGAPQDPNSGGSPLSPPSPVLPALNRLADDIDVVERVAPHSIHDVMAEEAR